MWGAATSAHQVEGGNVHNDWWEWEKKTPGVDRSGMASDHWNRWQEDVELASSLGHTAHRLSVEWSRIEPKEGQWSRAAIEHYRQVLGELQNKGLKTFVTLHHFTNPQWLARKGGWLNGETPELFERYARFVAQQLGEVVDFWITINEPMVYATQSYWRGVWPPQHRSLWEMQKVVRAMAAGHRKAYRAIHQVLPAPKVGMAKNLVAYLPEFIGQIDDQLVARAENWWFNHFLYLLTGDTHDFLGVNYYFTRTLRVKLLPPRLTEVPWEGARSDMGWPISPEGLTHVLLHMKRYKLPIYITENGLADADDSRRADFIRSHLRAVEAAQAQGSDVRGYLHWSLLDNFEWAEGFKPRFGLVAVDYATGERTVRPSAYVYKAIIEQAGKQV